MTHDTYTVFVCQVLLCCRKVGKELHWTYRCTSTLFFSIWNCIEYEFESELFKIFKLNQHLFNEFRYGKNCLFRWWWCFWWFPLNVCCNCFPFVWISIHNTDARLYNTFTRRIQEILHILLSASTIFFIIILHWHHIQLQYSMHCTTDFMQSILICTLFYFEKKRRELSSSNDNALFRV